MSRYQRTWRDVDGERIEGTWRHAFICNGGRYYLTDLKIYADGIVDCWDLITLDEFELKLAAGWVATEIPEGGQASAHDLASWTFSEPEVYVSADELLGEVKDEIDRLNGRPDSTERCVEAAYTFVKEPTERNRDRLRAAYVAVPEHLRMYMLKDMDEKDRPVQYLAAGPGNRTAWGDLVSERMHAGALQYFADREGAIAQWEARVRPEPDGLGASIYIPEVLSPQGSPQKLGIAVLRNNFPAEIVVEGQSYPSVEHAYWAQAVVDDDVRARVLAAKNGFRIKEAVRGARLRDDWEVIRLAVMTDLLRAKFSQHPDLAAVLAGTGASRLILSESDAPFWGSGGDQGRNWLGRLLEVVRSERARHHGAKRS